MVEDLYWDPRMAAKVLLDYEMDEFQAARLRYYWFVPKLIDSSGFSSGKTIIDWVYIQLRCLLLPDQHCGVYYPAFETGKNTFWPYYSTCTSRIFRAHLGRLDEEGDEEGVAKSQGAACYKAFFRNGSKMLMPAPSFMKSAMTQASMRFNTLLVEEWTHIDETSDGIDAQLIGRVQRMALNKDHPIWANHIHFTAPAKTQMHPAFKRFRAYQRNVAKGDPSYATLHYSYKDWSGLPSPNGKSWRENYRTDSIINDLRDKRESADFLAEALGVWSRNSKGWFSEASIGACVDAGRKAGIVPVMSCAGGVFTEAN